MGNDYETSSALQALGYLEGQAGDVRSALDYLHEALALCEGLPDTPQQKILLNHIQESIDEL
jgi:hypothetical protein